MADGHIDGLLRRVVAAGVDPVRAVRHATLVPARHYGLNDRGAVVPGRLADMVVVDDLVGFEAKLVAKRGVIVARDGEYLGPDDPAGIPAENTVNLGPLDERCFRLPLATDRAAVIGIVPDQIITRHETRTVTRDDGFWKFDPAIDVALIANIERHRATGGLGVGLVEGFKFRGGGALGSSVAHDAHNLIIAGTDAGDMLMAARALEADGGGFVVVKGGNVVARLPLPVAGLLSTEPAEVVNRQLRDVRAAAHELGCPLVENRGIVLVRNRLLFEILGVDRLAPRDDRRNGRIETPLRLKPPPHAQTRHRRHQQHARKRQALQPPVPPRQLHDRDRIPRFC